MSMFGPPKPVWEIIFDKYDTDKSGSIDASEFQNLVYQLGYALSQLEIDLALKLLDGDASGKLDKAEFKKWWANPKRWEELKLDSAGLENRSQVASVFNAYDPKKTGFIGKTDFDKFYTDLVASKLTKLSKQTFLEDLDANGDGKINFGEYVAWLKKQGIID